MMRTTALFLLFLSLAPPGRADDRTIFVTDVSFRSFPAKKAAEVKHWGPALAEEIRAVVSQAPGIKGLTLETLKSQLGKEKLKQTMACDNVACVNRIVENFGCSETLFAVVRYVTPTKIQVTLSHSAGGELLKSVGPVYTKLDFDALSKTLNDLARELFNLQAGTAPAPTPPPVVKPTPTLEPPEKPTEKSPEKAPETRPKKTVKTDDRRWSLGALVGPSMVYLLVKAEGDEMDYADGTGWIVGGQFQYRFWRYFSAQVEMDFAQVTDHGLHYLLFPAFARFHFPFAGLSLNPGIGLIYAQRLSDGDLDAEEAEFLSGSDLQIVASLELTLKVMGKEAFVEYRPIWGITNQMDVENGEYLARGSFMMFGMKF